MMCLNFPRTKAGMHKVVISHLLMQIGSTKRHVTVGRNSLRPRAHHTPRGGSTKRYGMVGPNRFRSRARHTSRGGSTKRNGMGGPNRFRSRVHHTSRGGSTKRHGMISPNCFRSRAHHSSRGGSTKKQYTAPSAPSGTAVRNAQHCTRYRLQRRHHIFSYLFA